MQQAAASTSQCGGGIWEVGWQKRSKENNKEDYFLIFYFYTKLVFAAVAVRDVLYDVIVN